MSFQAEDIAGAKALRHNALRGRLERRVHVGVMDQRTASCAKQLKSWHSFLIRYGEPLGRFKWGIKKDDSQQCGV